MVHLIAALLAAFVGTALAASPPRLVNPSFQPADGAGGKPAGWLPISGQYDVRTECAPTCVLHIRSRAGGKGFDGVYQPLAPGAAAGYVVTVSTRIRTDDVTGKAFLHARVNGARGLIAEHEDGAASASGTTGWRRAVLRVPVPPNATELLIGAVLHGRGDAWIDSLELAVDTSVATAPHVPPSMPSPPQPSQRLLDDAALRLADADMPSIAPAWRDDVRARRHPVRSLFSDDFSDLQFLKPLLAGKRIVQLGEAAHGVAESNWAKVRLIKFLHQQMGFDVVAFEGSFDQCRGADGDIGRLAPHAVMAQCLFLPWHTHEVAGLFDYLAAVRAGAAPLALAGFDIQFSGNRDDSRRQQGMLALADPDLARRFPATEKELQARRTLTARRSADIQAFYAAVAGALGAHRAQLEAAGHAAADIDAAIQTARGRTWLARMHEHLDTPNGPAAGAVRDAGMAAHMDFLLDQLHPRSKVIVWGHNLHVSQANAAGDFTSMGEILARRRRAEMYTVGIYMGRGVASNGQPHQWKVAPPPPDTLEGVLANGGLKYAFVDFSQAKPGPSTAWFNDMSTVREFGTERKTIVPSRAYDAILYIDTVTPARQF